MNNEQVEGFKTMGVLGDLSVYEALDRFPWLDSTSSRTIEVGTEDKPKMIEKECVGISIGADPCITGVSLHQGAYSVWHSFGDKLGVENEELILSSEGGIVGGGKKLLSKYRSLLDRKGYQIKKPGINKKVFNIYVVNITNGILASYEGRLITLPRAIYYKYH